MPSEPASAVSRAWGQVAARERDRDRRRPVVHAELGVHVHEVALNGRFADEKAFGSFAVGGALRDQLEDFDFTV